ncbi:MAG TPA: peptide-methionine (S)-S-oxide reductase [Methylophilaceae bacterium]|jgi:peptide-methionine (S)-S-oxide reductase|nr:peptide-methionine (S)-S-oxide reductase [Methylophilaceae bacterium]
MAYMETIYLAGGCYWGLEDLIRQIPGVLSTQVGFSGGHIKNVCYKEVTKGDTGHAETIKIEFNPELLPLKQLLLHFFKVHDPTTPNQQGNDRGTQYRSAIFCTNTDQKEIAMEAINLVEVSACYPGSIVTSLEDFSAFYPAEESHQKYIQKNPGGYTCHFIRDITF